MREVIERILEGKYADEDRYLELSCSALEVELEQGRDYQGFFTISSQTCIEGILSVSDARMELSLESFQGEEIRVDYLFHGEHLAEGEEAKGEIYILTNQGEWTLPFTITVCEHTLDSSIGPIKNLFHFANLAKTNWTEAQKIFYSPAFLQVFHGNDKKYYMDYKGLSVYGNQQNMEEFLIRINKKQRVDYQIFPKQLETTMLFAKDYSDLIEQEIMVTRNGWGYTQLFVEVQGDICVLPKTVLSEDDFIGSSARLTVFIDPSACGQGRNQAKIILKNVYFYAEIPVVVTVGERGEISETRIDRKRNEVEIFRLYQKFRLHKINLATWLKETHKIVDRMISMDEQAIRFRMYKAQLLITEERTNEAGWMLKHVASMLEEQEETPEIRDMKVYYLYLTTLVEKDPDYLEDVTKRVKAIYRNDPGNWKTAWLLMFLDEKLQESAEAKWRFLEEQFEQGSNSFAIYLEALYVLNHNPAMLRKLGEFETQILFYGIKQQALTRDVVDQVIYLAAKDPQYHPVMYRLMCLLLRERKDPRILQIVCTMLIGAGLYGKQYLRWYEAGVQEKLRITNLYEYYMMSASAEGRTTIPKAILMYFSYQNNLGADCSAYLYRYVVEHKNEFPELYGTYLGKIKQFVLEQLDKKHITTDLAFLYDLFLSEETLSEKQKAALSELAYGYEVTVEASNVRKMFVYQPGVLKPVEYALSNGTGVVSLYGEDSVLVFEDEKNNRFLDSQKHMKKQLMIPGHFMPLIADYIGNICLDVCLYRQGQYSAIVSSEQESRAKRLFESKLVEDSLRVQAGIKLLEYHYARDEMTQVEEDLHRLSELPLAPEERGELLKYYVLRGDYKRAYDMLVTYGARNVDVSTLLRLLGGLTGTEEAKKDPVLIDACAYVLSKGKYNGAVLQYLTKFYEGPVKKLRAIYKADREFGIDAFALAEKILIQLVFTGAFLGDKNAIFAYYVSQGANENVEKAYLTQSAYSYFVKERLEDDEIFEELHHLYKRGEEIPLICKVAFLKYCSELGVPERKPYEKCIAEWVKDILKNRIRMNFLRQLGGEDVDTELADKTIIEYRSTVGAKAKIHYMMVDEYEEDSEYRSEYMREIFPGVYAKEFVLFFGETLQYYIVEENGDESLLTESATIQKNDINMEGGNSRYNMINDILISKSLQDYDTLDSTIEDYMIKDYFNENLFIKR